MVRVARVYDRPGPEAGLRVLVDRLWPRGVARQGAPWDRWLPEVAPSPELRVWFGHDPARWAEFGRRYREELAGPGPAQVLAALRREAEGRQLVLLTATRDPALSQAAVLAELLRDG